MVEQLQNGEKKVRKTFVGQVVSDKMDKTVVVLVERKYKHPLLGKIIKCAKKYKVHDEHSTAKFGDTVEFQEGRPISKSKCMHLLQVVKSGEEL